MQNTNRIKVQELEIAIDASNYNESLNIIIYSKLTERAKAEQLKAQILQDAKIVDALVEELKNREAWFNLSDFKKKQQTTTTHYESHKAIIFVLKKLLGVSK